MQNAAVSQGIQAAFRRRKRQGNEFFSRASRKKYIPAEILTFAQWALCPNLMYETIKEQSCVVLGH